MKGRSMAAKVYFVDMRATVEVNLLARFVDCMEKAGVTKVAGPKDLVGVKLHFGEKGCTAYLKPTYVRTVVETLAKTGCSVFLTDANTLYGGSRSDSIRHLKTAFEHGFSYASMGAPVIIADGLKGTSYQTVKIDGKHFQSVKIAADIARADALVVLTHVKGHELTGIGGALKNMGMGCGSRAGKLSMHSDVRPYVGDKCVGCGTCLGWCPVTAITLKDKRAMIASKICIGCGECMFVCPERAIKFQWDDSYKAVQEKIAEYALGVAKPKGEKIAYVNVLMDIAPQCDCYPFSDASIVANLGILASLDPVAIDQASADLINQAPGVPGTLVKDTRPGSDKFRDIYPELDWTIQIRHAEEIGLGTSKYTLVRV
ncbi:MAG TPA: DUF362 domain-containing protein [bacterium]|nr:DUF362 domain-containing protein [bacterium]